MSIAEPLRTLTAEDLADRPDDGVERDLIRGELRERPMTRRNSEHSGVESRVAYLLTDWILRSPRPHGRVHSGEVGFRLVRDPETFVGIDVAYVSPEQAAGHDRRWKFYEGPPVLAVEILSPSDGHGDVVEKVRLYLEVGTVAWLVDPDLKTVTVLRPDAEPVMFNVGQGLAGEPDLPGFRTPVAALFA